MSYKKGETSVGPKVLSQLKLYQHRNKKFRVVVKGIGGKRNCSLGMNNKQISLSHIVPKSHQSVSAILPQESSVPRSAA